MKKLPEAIRNIIVVSNEDLEDFSVMADKKILNELFNRNLFCSDSFVMSKMLQKISMLESQISALKISKADKKRTSAV